MKQTRSARARKLAATKKRDALIFLLKTEGKNCTVIANSTGLSAMEVQKILWRTITRGERYPCRGSWCAVCRKRGRVVCSGCQDKGRRNGWCEACKIPKGSIVGIGPVCMRCR